MYINIIIIIDDSNDMREGGASVSVRGRGAKRGGASVTMREGDTYDIKADIVATLFIVDDLTSINTSTRGHGATRRGASGPTRILRGGNDIINGIINTHLHNYVVTLDDSTIERRRS